MDGWVISDNKGNVFDVYRTKEAAMCQLIHKIAEDKMPDSKKWAAFKEMYDYSIIADDEMTVELSDGNIVYAEKRKIWGFKED